MGRGGWIGVRSGHWDSQRGSTSRILREPAPSPAHLSLSAIFTKREPPPNRPLTSQPHHPAAPCLRGHRHFHETSIPLSHSTHSDGSDILVGAVSTFGNDGSARGARETGRS